MAEPPVAFPIVLMGVSGSGKTTVGIRLARRLHRPFLDADDLHSPENKAKMAAGIPLTDEDRAPWLDVLAERLAATPAPVLACSALRRRYRDRLRHSAPATVFVHLDGSMETISRRLAYRKGHYMPASLLASQLETLEPLEPDERGFAVDLDRFPGTLVNEIVRRLPDFNEN